MSQSGYNNGAASGGGGHSMQPHPSPAASQQQPQPSPHAGMTYHQQQQPVPQQQQQPPSGPYMIGPGPSPGPYSSSQFPSQYRQQQPYQQHQSPAQSQQQSGRPAFVGITASTNRLQASPHQSTATFMAQQQQPNQLRLPQQQQQATFMIQQQPQRVMIHPQQNPQLIAAGGQQGPPQQMVVIRTAPQPQTMHYGNNTHNIVTSAGGVTMQGQGYITTGQYPRQVILTQPGQQPVILQSQASSPGGGSLLRQGLQTSSQFPGFRSQSQLQQTPQQMPQPLSNPAQQILQRKVASPGPVGIKPASPAPQLTAAAVAASAGPGLTEVHPNYKPPPGHHLKSPSAAMEVASSPSSVASASAATIHTPLAGEASASAAAVVPMLSDSSQVVTKQRLEDLVREVDPYEQLDDDVKEALLQIADEFIENVVSSACQIAKHRKSDAVDVKDVQLCLERNWNMWIPGFGSDEIRPYKKACVTDAHKQRMAVIKKTLKKT